MNAVRNVLFPTDLSDDSFAAWPYALDFAAHFDATVHAVTVVEELYALAPYENYGVMVQAMRDMLPQIEKRLQERVKDPPSKVPVKTAVLEAVTPAGALLDYVKKHSIDLIVMATHGRGALAHVLLGSVAERLIRNAPVPVMTVRPKGR